MNVCTTLINNKYQKAFENDKTMLDEMVKDIQDLRERHTSPDGFKKKLQEYIKDTSEEKILNEREQLRQIAKRESHLKRINDAGFKGNYAEALHSFLRQTNYNAKGSGNSIEGVMSVYNKKYQTHLDQNFSKADVDIIISGALDKEIIQHVTSGGNIKVSETAQRLGNAMKKLQDMIHADKRSNGIEVGYIKDYLINQRDIHTPDFFKNLSRDEYIDLHMKHLDHEKTFKYMNDDAAKREYLGDVFDGFTQRNLDKERVDFNNLHRQENLVQSSIQRKNLQPRTLHYTPEGLAEMWAKGSNKNLLESMLADSARASRDIAMYDVLGPRGENEFNTLKQKAISQLQEKRAAATTDAERTKHQNQIDRINRGGGSLKDLTSSYDNQWAVINGTVDQIEHKTWAAVNANFRAITNMAVLGNDMLSAFTDLGTGAINLSTATGGGILPSIAKQAEGLIRSLPPSQQKKVAHMLAISLESSMGNQLRVAGSEGITKGINKANYLFAKLNPAAAQGRFHRVAATTMLGLNLHEASRGSFADLNPWQRQLVEKAGISEHDWPAFAAMESNINGTDSVISHQHASQISDDAARAAIAANKAANPFFLPSTPNEYRAMMEKKVGLIYDEFSSAAAPNPGLRERAILMQGTKKGTISGELMRNTAMLKSFTIKQMSVMQKLYMSNPNGAPNIKHLSAQMAGLMTMGAAVLSLRAIRDNESMPDFTHPDTIKRLITTSGAFGPMADFALAETGIGADPFTNFVAGPALAMLGKAWGVGKKAIDAGLSDKKEFTAKDSGKALKLLPGSNLFYLKAAINYNAFGALQEVFKDPEAEKRHRKMLREQGRTKIVQ